MEKYVIKGGCRLTGEVNISGAKNAAVAIIPATILADSPCRLENLPDISDVKTLTYILESMGAKVEYLDRHTVEIDPPHRGHRHGFGGHCPAHPRLLLFPGRFAGSLPQGRGPHARRVQFRHPPH